MCELGLVCRVRMKKYKSLSLIHIYADVDEVRGRLLDPREYWGGAYGVVAHTQVIKQADVIAMLMLLNGQPRWVEEANYTYYSPRTEHGSSLSAVSYTHLDVYKRQTC